MSRLDTLESPLILGVAFEGELKLGYQDSKLPVQGCRVEF